MSNQEKIYSGHHDYPSMAKMASCPCGWVIISPQGEGDAVKHTAIHLKIHHPGTELTNEEMRKKVLSV
jgi:hypothetical protein